MSRSLPTAFVVLSFLVPGCALVEGSSESTADSLAGSMEAIASPFESSSRSLGGGGSQTQASQAYQRDVVAYALAYLDDPEGDASMLLGLGRVAEIHGITDWEASPDTLEALTAAAHSGQLSSEQLTCLKQELAPVSLPIPLAASAGR